MKRVLNSGTIKLPYVEGHEADVLRTAQGAFIDQHNEQEACGKVVNSNSSSLDRIKFTFEVKAPLLVFNTISQADLGTLNLLEGAEDLESYLPSQFYKQDASSFIPMDSKICNELNTKLNNFYNWSFNFYKKLMESGLCERQAALMLPQGLLVTFSWQITAQELITFIEKYNTVSPEIYGYCSVFMIYLQEHLPVLMRYIRKNKWQDLNL